MGGAYGSPPTQTSAETLRLETRANPGGKLTTREQTNPCGPRHSLGAELAPQKRKRRKYQKIFAPQTYFTPPPHYSQKRFERRTICSTNRNVLNGGDGGSRTRVLNICPKRFYMFSRYFKFNPLAACRQATSGRAFLKSRAATERQNNCASLRYVALSLPSGSRSGERRCFN